jgi:hypothetical protein
MLVVDVVDGVTTPEEGRELVSRAFDDVFSLYTPPSDSEALDFFLMFESCSGGPNLSFIGGKIGGWP